MEYIVQVVEDDQLPPASPWVVVVANDARYLFVTRAKILSPLAMCGILLEVAATSTKPSATVEAGMLRFMAAAKRALDEYGEALALAV